MTKIKKDNEKGKKYTDSKISIIRKGKDVKDLGLSYSCCRKSQRLRE